MEAIMIHPENAEHSYLVFIFNFYLRLNFRGAYNFL